MPSVLVVHENPDIHHLVETALAAQFRIVPASSEEEAVSQLKRWQIDLVICDVALQKQSGVLMKRLRGRNDFIRIALLLILGEDDNPSQLPHDDAEQDYVLQPLRPAELLVRCNKLLAMTRSMEELAAQALERGMQLEQSENRFRLMVESIEDYAMFMVSLSGEIISWNRGAERLTGYKEEEAVGRHFSILYPREELDERHALHELSMAGTLGRYEEEGKRVRKDGSVYLAQITVWRVDDAEGRPIGFAKITRDVTSRKMAQEREVQLLESETRFRLMVDSLQDYAMFMVDLQGYITSWNRGAERLTGYTEAEAIGRQFSMLYPREDFGTEHALYELAMAREKGLHEEEGPRLRKDGSVYYAHVLMWPMADSQGEIVGFAKITRDITMRRQAEQVIKESEAKFRTITDAMPQMVWSTLPNGDHDYFNKQWYDFTGVPEGSTNGAGWNGMLHPEDQERAANIWQQSLRTGETYEVQYRLRHHSGTYRWTLALALPVRNEEGVIVRWMGTLTDIQKQKEAEEALKEAGRRKDEFLAMLAHELRNPLAPVRNSTFLLHRLLDQSNERAVQVLNVIDRQVRHMTCLIDDLLDVARISRGKVKIRKEILDLVEVVRHTLEDFEADSQAKSIHLKTDIRVTGLSIAGDRTRIAQVVGNLLHNAFKFTEVGGEVLVEVDRETGGNTEMAVVRIKDSGTGIAPDVIPTLFQPFIQADQGLARSKGGLGLGLALVKGFVDLHGGVVEAHSEGLGCGSTFIARLPLAQAPLAENTVKISPVPAHQLRILLIEDNSDMRETLRAILNLHGHEVFTAADGAVGLGIVRKTRPDLVLCDIGLPGEYDGFGVAQQIRADPELADVYLVALSGYGQEQDRQRARQSGFDHHLLKPVDFAALASVIADASTTRQEASLFKHIE